MGYETAFLEAVVVGRGSHVHAYDGEKEKLSLRTMERNPRTVCGQVFDSAIGYWLDETSTPRCQKCVRLLS